MVEHNGETAICALIMNLSFDSKLYLIYHWFMQRAPGLELAITDIPLLCAIERIHSVIIP